MPGFLIRGRYYVRLSVAGEVSDGLYVVVCHISGLAGPQVHNLAPDAAAGDDLQLIAGLQAADLLGSLAGHGAQSDALAGLGVQRLGNDGVGVYGDEVLEVFGGLVFAELPGLQVFRLDIAGGAAGPDQGPAVAVIVHHFNHGAVHQLFQRASFVHGVRPYVQGAALRAVDDHGPSVDGAGRGECGAFVSFRLVCVVRADTSGYGRLFPDGSKSGICSHSVHNVHGRAWKAKEDVSKCLRSVIFTGLRLGEG